MMQTNRIILCVGFRGLGKSSVASEILRWQQAAFICDPHFDPAYKWIENTAHDEEALGDYSRWYGQTRGIEPGKRACLRFVPDGRRDYFDCVEEFCAWVWTWRNVWICIEEIAEATRSTASSGMPPELRRLVSQGRHRGINQVYCGLRYSEIPRPISAGADIQILFACREPLDLDAMRQRIGQEAVEEVSRLKRFECLIFFPDRSWKVVGNRDSRIPELVLRDGVDNLARDRRRRRLPSHEDEE